jgi:hypothetical protein
LNYMLGHHRVTGAVLITVLLHPLSAAVRGEHAAYVGGTVAALKQR